MTPIWRRTSSTTRSVATESASGRSGVPVSPAAIRRATSTAVTKSPSCPIVGSVNRSVDSLPAEVSTRSPGAKNGASTTSVARVPASTARFGVSAMTVVLTAACAPPGCRSTAETCPCTSPPGTPWPIARICSGSPSTHDASASG